MKGLSKKYWLLHITSITLARDLSIHVLDHPARPKSKNVIENEVKRRIWWFLATTDWFVHPNVCQSAVLIASQGYWAVCLVRKREHTASTLDTVRSTCL
jgi:hypothetical protein